jgi:hypothetical protein
MYNYLDDVIYVVSILSIIELNMSYMPYPVLALTYINGI